MDGFEAKIEPGNMPNLFYYVAYKDGVELARERVPLHVAQMVPEKAEFHLRLIAKKLARKIRG